MAQHRARLVPYVQAILQAFWRDEDTAGVVQAVELQGWLDVLEPLSESEVRRAWADYQKSGPRSGSGRLLRPDAGAIRQIAMNERADALRKTRAVLPPPTEPPRERVSAEAAAAILADLGFRPRRFTDDV